MRYFISSICLLVLGACGKTQLTGTKPAPATETPSKTDPAKTTPVSTTTPTSGTTTLATGNSNATVPAATQNIAPVVAADADFVNNLPTHAIQKGSFAVWTLPEDPYPGQDYVIVIAIDLPEGTIQYNRSDITGSVFGTDGFVHRVGIGADRYDEQFSFDGKNAQLSIDIPGAENLVRDSIQVRSQILSEEQQLEIVF